MRRAAKTDANQQEIVDALRSIGFQVLFIGKPVDLLLCSPLGQWSLMEVKTAKGRLTKAQKRFLALSKGKVHIARSVDQALSCVLGKAMS